MCFIRSFFISGVNIVLMVSMSSESQSIIVHLKCYDGSASLTLKTKWMENVVTGVRLGHHSDQCHSDFRSGPICEPAFLIVIGIRAHLCPWRSGLGSPPSSASQRISLRASRPANQHSPETNRTLTSEHLCRMKTQYLQEAVLVEFWEGAESFEVVCDARDSFYC